MNELSKLKEWNLEMARDAMQTPDQKQVDNMQAVLLKLPQTDCPLTHRFTPNLYTREIFMPKGTLIISKIHKTEHPFVIVKGKVSVWVEEIGTVTYTAPYVGITKPGTRRVLYIHEDCSWLTFHATDKTTPEEVEADVIYDPKKEDEYAIDAEIVNQLQEAN